MEGPCAKWGMNQRKLQDEGMPKDREVIPYVSVLLSRTESIFWTVSNFGTLLDTNCWPAMCMTFDCRGSLGRLYTWRLSLFADEDYLYGRAELILPMKFRIPYSMKFSILNKPSDFVFSEEEDSTVREISNHSEPQKWKILDKKYLLPLRNRSPELLELKVEVTTYGSETTKDYSIQNYPY